MWETPARGYLPHEAVNVGMAPTIQAVAVVIDSPQFIGQRRTRRGSHAQVYVVTMDDEQDGLTPDDIERIEIG